MDLLTREETAEFFKAKNAKVISNWLYQEILPRNELTVKIGGRLFFLKEKLEEFILNKMHTTKGQ
jgi:hypothetical protein